MLVEAFEQLCLKHDLEKIKTIGDAFMASAGLMTASRQSSAPLRAVRSRHGGRCSETPGELAGPHWRSCRARHCRSSRHRKYQDDVWGDAVNTASRLEQAAAWIRVCVNKDTWNLVAEHCCGRPLGRIELKGKGEQEIFVVNGISS